MSVTSEQDPQRYLRAQVAQQEVLFCMDEVVQILPMMALKDPGPADPRCLGLAHLSHDVVPVFWMPGQSRQVQLSQLIVVVHDGNGPLGMVVDDIADIIEVEPDTVATRRLGPNREARFARVGDALLAIMDPADALS